MGRTPMSMAGEEATVAEQERKQLLSLVAQILTGGFPSPDQIADRFVISIRYPDRRQFAGPQQASPKPPRRAGSS